MRKVFILMFYDDYFLCLYWRSCPHLWRTGWRSRSRCAGSARPSRYCCTPACSSGPPASPSHPGCCSSAGTLKCYTSCHRKPPFQTPKQATTRDRNKTDGRAVVVRPRRGTQALELACTHAPPNEYSHQIYSSAALQPNNTRTHA